MTASHVDTLEHHILVGTEVIALTMRTVWSANRSFVRLTSEKRCMNLTFSSIFFSLVNLAVHNINTLATRVRQHSGSRLFAKTYLVY
jgi:hypothetical protein